VPRTDLRSQFSNCGTASQAPITVTILIGKQPSSLRRCFNLGSSQGRDDATWRRRLDTLDREISEAALNNTSVRRVAAARFTSSKLLTAPPVVPRLQPECSWHGGSGVRCNRIRFLSACDTCCLRSKKPV
jgi:hypothetical protein